MTFFFVFQVIFYCFPLILVSLFISRLIKCTPFLTPFLVACGSFFSVYLRPYSWRGDFDLYQDQLNTGLASSREPLWSLIVQILNFLHLKSFLFLQSASFSVFCLILYLYCTRTPLLFSSLDNQISTFSSSTRLVFSTSIARTIYSIAFVLTFYFAFITIYRQTLSISVFLPSIYAAFLSKRHLPVFLTLSVLAAACIHYSSIFLLAFLFSFFIFRFSVYQSSCNDMQFSYIPPLIFKSLVPSFKFSRKALLCVIFSLLLSLILFPVFYDKIVVMVVGYLGEGYYSTNSGSSMFSGLALYFNLFISALCLIYTSVVLVPIRYFWIWMAIFLLFISYLPLAITNLQSPFVSRFLLSLTLIFFSLIFISPPSRFVFISLKAFRLSDLSFLTSLAISLFAIFKVFGGLYRYSLAN